MASFVALAAFVLAGAACGGKGNELDLDAGCDMPGAVPDRPAVQCPEEVDLGCIDSSGARLDLSVATATCDGSDPTVTCTPGDGDLVTPGATMTGRCVATAASGATDECDFPIRYRVDGPSEIACSAPTEIACAGARTPALLEPPVVMASCTGGEPAEPTNDAPEGGLPVGTTEVTWTAAITGGAPLSCSARVTVTDEVPPTLICPGGESTIVRTAPGAPIEVDTPAGSDECDDSVDVAVEPMPTERGTYDVTATATDDAGNASTCDYGLRVLDVFAPTDLRVVSAELAGDGTTDVTLGWEPSTGADVTEVRLERAEASGGLWTELATLSVGTTTYTDASMPSPDARYRLVALAGSVEGGVTDPVLARAVADDEYHLRDQSVPGIPFDTSLFGVVRHPADPSGGPYPLVVMMHGNHGNCRPSGGGEDECSTITGHECMDVGYTTAPNAQGYVYLQETLAARGYVSVSLSANALNCREDFIPERTQLILEHLRRWVDWSASGGAPFGTELVGAVDTSRVSLFGHSRGGEAVASTPAALADTPISGVDLAGVFVVGPTDYHEPEPSGVPFAVLLPGCDGDVRTLEGLRQYDRGLDPTDEVARAQVLYVGANHNFFNSEWRFDDNERLERVCGDSSLVGEAAQRAMLEIVLPDWIEATAGGAFTPPYIRADSGTPSVVDTWAGRDLDLRWSYSAAMRRVIDDFEGSGAPDVNDLGGANDYGGMIASISCGGGCARNWNHLVGAVRPAWQTDPAYWTWTLGGVDATPYEVVSMRFASRIATINSGLTAHDFWIRVRDASGTSAQVELSSEGRLPHGYPSSAEQEILNTVRVPLSSFEEATPGLDISRLDEVEIAFPSPAGNDEGSIWVADVDLAGN